MIRETNQHTVLLPQASPDRILDDGMQVVSNVDTHEIVGPLQQPRMLPMLMQEAPIWPQVSDSPGNSAYHPQIFGGRV